MPTSRLIFAALLMAAPMLCAQESSTKNPAVNAAPAPSAVHVGRQAPAAFEPLQFTIIFKRTHADKTTIQNTYTITASPQQADPQIRDDSRIPIKCDSSNTANPCSSYTPEYFNNTTDVDVQNIRKIREMVSLTLRISQEGFPQGLSKDRSAAVTPLASHRYTVSPTVPMGKLTTVYSMSDGINNYKVEVLLLVQPLNVK
jgi:hypothetical protein